MPERRKLDPENREDFLELVRKAKKHGHGPVGKIIDEFMGAEDGTAAELREPDVTGEDGDEEEDSTDESS